MAYISHRYEGQANEQVTKYVVNRKDIMHLDNFYLLTHEWLVEHGYAPREDSEFPEKYYLHKEGPGGKEMWWRWRPKRYPLGGGRKDQKNRWRFDLDIDVHVLTMKDVEAVIAGKKYKAHQGEVEIQVVANLVEDPEKGFEQGILKDIKKMLYKRVWAEQREMLKEEMYRDAMQFRDAVNTFLTIETYLPTKEWAEFWPKRVPE